MDKQEYLTAAAITAECIGVTAIFCWSISPDSGWMWQALLIVSALVVAYREVYLIIHNR